MYWVNLLLVALYRFSYLIRTRHYDNHTTQAWNARFFLAALATLSLFSVLKSVKINLDNPIKAMIGFCLTITVLLKVLGWDSETIVSFEEDSNNESEIQLANKVLMGTILTIVFLFLLQLIYS